MIFANLLKLLDWMWQKIINSVHLQNISKKAGEDGCPEKHDIVNRNVVLCNTVLTKLRKEVRPINRAKSLGFWNNYEEFSLQANVRGYRESNTGIALSEFSFKMSFQRFDKLMNGDSTSNYKKFVELSWLQNHWLRRTQMLSWKESSGAPINPVGA